MLGVGRRGVLPDSGGSRTVHRPGFPHRRKALHAMNPTTPTTPTTSTTVAVLGGTGFFGRNVCAAFQEAGYPVVSIGRTAAEPPPGCRAVRTDLTETDPRQLAAL